jgi:hypothetical protein
MKAKLNWKQIKSEHKFFGKPYIHELMMNKQQKNESKYGWLVLPVETKRNHGETFCDA